MSFKAQKAQRQSVKLKIGLQGPSGSGKTLSALLLANGIVGGDMSKVAVSDTENRSAAYYAGRPKIGNDWYHIPFDAPYSPQRYIEVIEYAESIEGVECLVMDSVSHEWEAEGGALDIHTKATEGSRSGNSYIAWGKVTPQHRAFVDRLRESRLHIIATTRAKQDYVLDKDNDGRQVVKKVGLKGIQREGFEYEMGIVFELNMDHYAQATKDRTGVFMPLDPFIITPETGHKLIGWASSGVEVYENHPEQRVILFDVFKDLNITDNKSLMQVIAARCYGIDMLQLKSFVVDCINTVEGVKSDSQNVYG